MPGCERDFYMDNLLIRIHSTIEMILVDRPCAIDPFLGSLISTVLFGVRGGYQLGRGAGLEAGRFEELAEKGPFRVGVRFHLGFWVWSLGF